METHEHKDHEHKHEEHDKHEGINIEMPAEKKHVSPLKLYKMIAVVAFLLLIVIAFSLYTSYDINTAAKEANAKALESLRPAAIEIISIRDKTCSYCFDTDKLLPVIKQSNINITKETYLDYSEKEAKDLIKEYNIQKLPALIVNGEIEKASLPGFTKTNDASILSQINPPYLDLASNKIKGLVSATIINAPNCESCFNVTTALDQLKPIIKITEEIKLKSSKNEAQDLIQKYSINLLPTLILSEDVFEYQQASKILEKLGTKESDGSYVLRSLAPPYYNVSSGEIKSRVKLTMLVDKSCTTCYNVSTHKRILTGFNLIPYKEETVDISSSLGQDLVKKYGIKAAPTIILSEEASVYNVLNGIWSQVGTVESDGVYVFRNIEVIGEIYKDLSSDKIIEPPKTQE